MKKLYSATPLALIIVFSCVNVSFGMKKNREENIEKKNAHKSKCRYCQKIFTTKNYLDIHKRDFCKKNPSRVIKNTHVSAVQFWDLN